MTAPVERSVRLLLCTAAVLVLAMTVAGCAELEASIRKMMENLTIDQVDLAQVKDGTYEGAYDGGLVKAKVRVTVSGHRITDLTLLRHDNGLGRKAESIVKTVVEAQSLAVDTVSGATHSSKVVLKAIELALKQGLGGEPAAGTRSGG